MGSGSGKVVCVTGASGYIASCLVKLLLGHGYTVKATVRDPGDPKKTAHLLALDGAQERLHLFKADLLTPDCFDSLVEGCHGVFHTASPAFISSSNPQVDLIDPAVKGTLNVLKSCAKASSIKRVVLTSSVASIAYNGKSDVVIDETCFSDLAFCEQPKRWYVLSKILAEEAAVKFAKDNEIDLVIMNPGHVIGPLLQPTLNLSVEVITNLIKGVRTFISSSCRYVDVRDVAYAHLQAFEIPSANGRYLLVGRTAHHSEVMRILHQLYPTLISPNMCEYYLPLEATLEISKEKAKTLGICFTPLEVSLKDTIESLKEKNLLGIPTVTQSSLPS